MKLASLALLGAASFALVACGPPQPPAVSAPAARPLATAAVELREIELTTTAEAVVEAVRQSTVSAQVSGRIVDIRFDVGDLVRKGDVILRIDQRAATQAEAATQAQVREAEASLINARSQYERTKQLVAQKFMSQAALDKAEADFRSAESRMKGALAGAGAASTERSFTTIVAPYSGVVSARLVQLGEMATPGKPLLTGFDPSSLRVVATVASAQVPSIQAGARARIEIPSLERWVDVKSVTVVPSADMRTHTTQVRLDLPANAKGLLPGVFARAHFVTGKAPRLMAPRAAVLYRSEVTAVYVVDEKGAPGLRQVRLGTATDEKSVEVLAGLKAGERVAVEPVKAGMTTGAAG
ncbi:MAG TPA: efflux RND transporter periplasmic adaptor subunit [Usitatibacteraceae bacterium]|nr:efflux RND transporter periplasmic adaptor subunit [Usitatibacteraceae bacterium]